MKNYYTYYIVAVSLLAGINLVIPTNTQAANYKQYTYTNKEQNYTVNDLHLSDDGQRGVAVGSGGNNGEEIFAFTPSKKRLWRYVADGGGQVYNTIISGDGSTVVACGSKLWVLDAKSGKLIWDYTDTVYDSCAVSQDGSTILAGDNTGHVLKWSKTSRTPKQTWKFSYRGFVNDVAISSDGSRAFAQDQYSYAWINTTATGLIGETSTTKEIVGAGMSANGNRAFVITNQSGGTGTYHLSVISPSGSTQWTNDYQSYNTPFAAISKNGKHIALSTNDEYYGINGKTGSTSWNFKRNGDNTNISLAQTGKYVLITEGLKYVYVFDWNYPDPAQRPTHIFQGIFPDSAAISGDGSTSTFASSDFQFNQLNPAILVDQSSVPVYQVDDLVKLRYFITNPGLHRNLKVKVSLSLPQTSFLSDAGATVDGEPQSVKGKLLNIANDTLPGYRTIDEAERSYIIKAHSSTKETVTFAMPNMILPTWFSDFLSSIGLDDVFNTLIGLITNPFGKLMDNATALLGQADTLRNQGSVGAVMVGVGTAQLYDGDTNKVYSEDTFFFLYTF